jgi:hypothetical protein
LAQSEPVQPVFGQQLDQLVISFLTVPFSREASLSVSSISTFSNTLIIMRLKLANAAVNFYFVRTIRNICGT